MLHPGVARRGTTSKVAVGGTHLPKYPSHKDKGDASVVVRLNQVQQVVAEDLHDHAYVCPMRAVVFEVVHQQHHALAAFRLGVCVADGTQQFDLVFSCFRVMRGALRGRRGREQGEFGVSA